MHLSLVSAVHRPTGEDLHGTLAGGSTAAALGVEALRPGPARDVVRDSSAEQTPAVQHVSVRLRPSLHQLRIGSGPGTVRSVGGKWWDERSDDSCCLGVGRRVDVGL